MNLCDHKLAHFHNPLLRHSKRQLEQISQKHADVHYNTLQYGVQHMLATLQRMRTSSRHQETFKVQNRASWLNAVQGAQA